MKTAVPNPVGPLEKVIRDAKGKWIATLTRGAYTAILLGPKRTFREPTAGDKITHAVWVRTLPSPSEGRVNRSWLTGALKANERGVPDVLAIAMQYIAHAPQILEEGLQIAGNASYGPLVGGHREEGADFNDYLGVTWTYPEGIDKSEQRQRHCLDCSGFVRMVFGFRHHLPGGRAADRVPLSLKPQPDHSGIPRRAHQIYRSAPGVVTIRNRGAQVTNFSALATGDLVFFDADEADGGQIDHVGIYLGTDQGGHHRFISSRKSANGPTFGDYGGKSILDGTGLYARSFRAARRL